MGTLIAKATGLLTGAATFAAAEVGAGATNLIRFNHTGAVSSTQTSVAFTVTNAKVIDGVLLWVRQSQTGSTGTFKVDLQKGGVSQASVTVNKVDLPEVGVGNQNSPVFFKFTGTATGDGGSNWTLVLTVTGSGSVNYCTTVSGATQITRALRTTTNATPAAADDLYVTGELTGAGTHNSFTVTMDSTAATAYGNGAVNSTTVNGGLIAISNWGTLTYGTTASTNYILRVAGDIRVNQYGTLNIGSAGAEIPRTSTAVLEFVQVSANADMGLYAYDYATVNIAGLSRTSGKDVVKCKLTSDLASANLITFGSSTGATQTSYTRDPEATGTTLFGATINENAASSTHGFYYNGASVTNVTQTVSVWLAQGTTANNRYLRVAMGNAAVFTGITNGFWADVDLQAGTISAITNVGTGVGASATITASGAGWLVKMTGKISTTAATPHFLMNACSAAGTVTYTGNTANWPFVHDHVGMVTAASIPDTTFNVDADTGWLAGDIVAVAATTRTYSEVTLYPLNANAGASSFTSALFQNNVQQNANAFSYTCSGTAPAQAEIGLLTRNVKIRATTATFGTFLYCSALATMTVSWAEFYRIGGSGVGKRGIEFDAGATANPKSFTYCSMHDFTSGSAFYCTGGSTSLNVTFANNITWFLGTSVNIVVGITNTDWTVDNCLFMRNFASAVTLSDVGGTFTNNTSTSASSGNQIALSETNGVVGTFDGNTIHSGGTAGFILSANGMAGTLNNCTVWRNPGGNGGVWYNGACPDLVFTNLTLFGNNTTNIVYGVSGGSLNVFNATICGETGYPTTNGVNFTTGTVIINFTNVDMSGTGTGQAPHTTDFTFPSAPADPRGNIINCKFGPSTPIKTNWTTTGYIGYSKFNQTAGDHRCEMRYGQIKTDTVLFNTAAPSMRMTPNTAGIKLESAPSTYGVKIPVAVGSAVDVSVWVRKSVVGDGAAYNGNQPRLVQRSNAAIGANSDVVLDTASVAAGSWEQLTGTSSVPTDDGVWEFIIDCDGTAGWVSVDDWAFVGAATTANGMKNWYDGIPVVGGSGGGGGASGYFSGGFV